MSEFIDALLAESELPDDPVLRDLLTELEREATSVRPMPSHELRQLMRARTGRRVRVAGRTGVIVGVAVIGALGLGVGAAAASPDARSAIGAGVAAIAHLFQPEAAATTPRSPVGTAPSSGTVSTHQPSSPPSATPTPSDHSAHGGEPSVSNPGSDAGSGSTHGNGTGNQSGNGNGKGRGNGGPAPTP